jgi:hypothetical protein
MTEMTRKLPGMSTKMAAKVAMFREHIETKGSLRFMRPKTTKGWDILEALISADISVNLDKTDYIDVFKRPEYTYYTYLETNNE